MKVPSSKCSSVYEERCAQPTREVCDQVTRVSQHNRYAEVIVFV